MNRIFGMALVLSMIISLGFPNTTGLFAQSEKNSALLGTWDVELTDMGMVMQFIYKMEKDVLTGSLEFDMGESVMEDIVFNDNKLTFSVNIDAGGQMMGIEVEAMIEDDEMTGTMISDMGEAAFIGKKRGNL